MRRLAIGNALLAILLTFIILLSSVHTEASTLVAPVGQIVNNATLSNYFVIAGAPTTVTAGQSISGIVVTVYDSNGQVATKYKGCIYFTSTDPKSTLPYTLNCKYSFTIGSKGDKGIHTFSGFNLVTAGSQTITITDGTISTTTGTITVNHTAESTIVVSPTTATVAAGNSQTYASTAKDYYGNSWDVTALTIWSITTGAGGSWSSNKYSSANSGTWTVTGSCSNFYNSVLLTVNPASAISITIIPSSTIVSAGGKTTCTDMAYDNYGNSWNVTGSTTWSISSAAGGSWSGSVYTSAKSGIWTITGNFGTLSAQASLNVTHSSPISIVLSPASATISAGSSQTFTASASDFYGNTWDATNVTTWSIDSGAGGSWASNIYTSSKVGIWAVSGSSGGVSNTASLTVGYTSVFTVTIYPKTATLNAGSSLVFSATASDIYGNKWDVTASTVWSIALGAGGSWSNNTYTSALSGTWVVTGTYRGISGTASATVNNGAPVKIGISSTAGLVTAGSTVSYSTTAADNFGNTWDVSNSTTWTISSSAGGSWSTYIYTSAKAGTWTVTGKTGQLSSTCLLTVTNGLPIGISVSPKTSSLAAGSSEPFAATAYDNYGNNWDVSSLSTWSISNGAEGSWTGSTYTSAKANIWLVTGTYNNLSDTASLTVNHGSAASITLKPKTSNIIAGSTQTFTTTAFDNFGNSWDSTSSATFQVDPQASGSLSSNIYTSCNAGTWIVTAKSLGSTDTGYLTVTHSSPIAINVGPESASIIAGSSQPYNATASDTYGNIWDVTSATSWNCNSSAGGSWLNNNYNSAFTGSWTITGNYLGISDYAYLTVIHSTAINITVSPKTLILVAGSNEAFTSTASDQFGNQWDVSNSASWNVTAIAGGSWNGRTYTSGETGNWIVTATVGSLYDTSTLTVSHGSVLNMKINPSSTTITAGSTQKYTATAYDSNGNNWDVTSSTNWSIDNAAGGTWANNTYTSNYAGTWTVTGTYQGITSTSSLIVNHGSADSIIIGPPSSSIVAGSPQSFNATASDTEGNTWDVTSSTNWTIDDGAGGSWSANTYTSDLSGIWNVTGAFDNLSKSIYITVSHNAAASIEVTPDNASIVAGNIEIYSVTALDSFNNTWDITDSATFSTASNSGEVWTQNAYTADKAGVWTVTANVATLSDTTTLNVNHGSANSIAISPKLQIISSSSNQTFTTTAFDSNGNSWDATGSTIWTTDPSAGGLWSNNVYISDTAGNWIVTGTLSSLSDTASLTVNHGSIVNVTISPSNTSVNASS